MGTKQEYKGRPLALHPLWVALNHLNSYAPSWGCSKERNSRMCTVNASEEHQWPAWPNSDATYLMQCGLNPGVSSCAGDGEQPGTLSGLRAVGPDLPVHVPGAAAGWAFQEVISREETGR